MSYRFFSEEEVLGFWAAEGSRPYVIEWEYGHEIKKDESLTKLEQLQKIQESRITILNRLKAVSQAAWEYCTKQYFHMQASRRQRFDSIFEMHVKEMERCEEHLKEVASQEGEGVEDDLSSYLYTCLNETCEQLEGLADDLDEAARR